MSIRLCFWTPVTYSAMTGHENLGTKETVPDVGNVWGLGISN